MKEQRIIDTLAPVMQTHRMVVDRRVVEADAELLKAAVEDKDSSYSLFYQMTRLTADRGSLLHDDRLDAWAMCIQWFQQQAAQDQRSQQQTRLQEMLEAEVADFRGRVLMTADRTAMGMSLEQARMADAGGSYSWI